MLCLRDLPEMLLHQVSGLRRWVLLSHQRVAAGVRQGVAVRAEGSGAPRSVRYNRENSRACNRARGERFRNETYLSSVLEKSRLYTNRITPGLPSPLNCKTKKKHVIMGGSRARYVRAK